MAYPKQEIPKQLYTISLDPRIVKKVNDLQGHCPNRSALINGLLIEWIKEQEAKPDV